MVHLHPCALARCSCRLDLSLGIKQGWHPVLRNPEGAGTRAGTSSGKPNGLPF